MNERTTKCGSLFYIKYNKNVRDVKMSKNTKMYSFMNTGAPKLVNNSEWGELIKVIRFAVNGGAWFANGITKISYDTTKEFIRVYLNNNPREYMAYQTIEFNENCGIFSGKEAIIRLATLTHIDITLHDEIPELTDTVDIELVGMNIRTSKLGFTEAYTDRDCGIFKTENHDFHFCLNDNNPSNANFTFVKNTMMVRPTVYMCEGMDGIHSHIGKIFPFDAVDTTAHIGGDAYKNINSSLWQNGLFGWDYEWSNNTTNTSFTEIKWWVIGNGDNINLIMENPNSDAQSAKCRYRCFFFQVVHNGKEYTPIMNGMYNSPYKNFYDRINNVPLNPNNYHHVSYTFGAYSQYGSINNGKVIRPINTLLSNTILLNSTSAGSPTSVFLYPTTYVSNRYSGNVGMAFDTSDREVCDYNIMLNNTIFKNGKLGFVKFINNIVTSLMNGEVTRMIDNKNKDHLYFHFIDIFYNAAYDYALNDGYQITGYSTQYNINLFIDLLGKN